jgi:hypothetical protein
VEASPDSLSQDKYRFASDVEIVRTLTCWSIERVTYDDGQLNEGLANGLFGYRLWSCWRR